MIQEWSDTEVQGFIDMANIVIPERRMQFQIVADLVPFGQGETFSFIDIGCGDGLLTKALLDRFPKAFAYASDASDEMLCKAEKLFEAYDGRVKLSCHNMHESDYLEAIVSGPVGFITSSLAIHHCDDAEKGQLYRSAYQKLSSERAFIVIDAVRPASVYGTELNKKYWRQSIRKQSIELGGNEEQYDKYKQISIMFYDRSVPEDQPATLIDNLNYLIEAGLQCVDCFWHKCGFAVFGGYRS